jgi:hypothetical protein
MPENYSDPLQNGGEREQQQSDFESDTQRIIHRHLANKDDIITDEDIRNVRIGVIPPEPDMTQEELAEQFEKEIDAVSDTNATDVEKNGESAGQKLTPWDTIEE